MDGPAAPGAHRLTHDPNPYSAPATPVADPVDAGAQRPASKLQRLFTFVVDYAGVMLVSMVAGFVIALVGGGEALEATTPVQEMLFGVALYFGYYAVFEGLWSRTPGKWICGTVVLAQGGGRPSFGQVLGRTAARFIPFEFLSLLGSSGKAWHDTLAKTMVASTRRAT